jgi:hypothetical protein
MLNDDRERFLSADEYPVMLADGVLVDVLDDPHGFLSAGEGEDESTQYVGVAVQDPATGAHEALWSIGIPDHWSGTACRVHLWENVVGGYHDLLRAVRAQRDAELRERAEWEARDVVTT